MSKQRKDKARRNAAEASRRKMAIVQRRSEIARMKARAAHQQAVSNPVAEARVPTPSVKFEISVHHGRTDARLEVLRADDYQEALDMRDDARLAWHPIPVRITRPVRVNR